MDLRTLKKEERDLIIMMELKKILWEANIPSEYKKSLFQEELDLELFVIEQQQYRKGRISPTT